jgi:hypothetical protein
MRSWGSVQIWHVAKTIDLMFHGLIPALGKRRTSVYANWLEVHSCLNIINRAGGRQPERACAWTTHLLLFLYLWNTVCPRLQHHWRSTQGAPSSCIKLCIRRGPFKQWFLLLFMSPFLFFLIIAGSNIFSISSCFNSPYYSHDGQRFEFRWLPERQAAGAWCFALMCD